MNLRTTTLAAFLLVFLASLSSCELIGDIFEVGLWTGVIIVALVVGLIFWIIRRFRK